MASPKRTHRTSAGPSELLTDGGRIALALPSQRHGHRREASYAYVGPDGAVSYVVSRFADKSFAQQAVDPDVQRLLPNRGGTEPLLYRLPEVLAAVQLGQTIYVVEGEKDVQSAERAGLVATCNSGGAGKVDARLLEPLRGARDVIVVFDRDEPGRQHGLKLESILNPLVGRVRTAHAARGKDLTEHLEAGLGPEDLVFRRPRRQQHERSSSQSRSPNGRVGDKDGEEIPPVLRRALGRLHDVRKTGPASWMARCPAPDHVDAQPSFSIARGATQPGVVACHSRQCSLEEIAKGLGMSTRELCGATSPDEKPAFRSVAFSEIEFAEVEWLWPGYIPFGKLTILDGDPQLGKSLITTYLAARLSTGLPLADGHCPDQGSALFVCAEDDPADTIGPRLLAAGADPGRVRFLKAADQPSARSSVFHLPDHLSNLERMIEESDITFVVIDPITAFLHPRINSHSDASTRIALGPLAGVAQRTGAATVLVRHLNKGSDQQAIYRGGGSIAFTAAARSALVVGRHPQDRDLRVLAPTKSNLCAKPPSLSYEVVADDGAKAPTIRWAGVVDVSADEIVTKLDRGTRAVERDAARVFLQHYLEDGPHPADEVISAADEEGINPTTLKRAKRGLVTTTRVKAANGQIGGWVWSLIDTTDQGSSREG